MALHRQPIALEWWWGGGGNGGNAPSLPLDPPEPVSSLDAWALERPLQTRLLGGGDPQLSIPTTIGISNPMHPPFWGAPHERCYSIHLPLPS